MTINMDKKENSVNHSNGYDLACICNWCRNLRFAASFTSPTNDNKEQFGH